MQDMTTGQIEREDESGNGRDVAPGVALGQEERVNTGARQFSWEVFDRGRGNLRALHGRPEPGITVTRGHQIAINAVAFGLLGEPKTAILYIDKERCALGIRKAADDDPTAYRVSGKTKTSHMITGERILRALGIESAGHAQFYPGEMVGDVFAVGLNGARELT